jgi:protein tyrosine phosphatase
MEFSENLFSRLTKEDKDDLSIPEKFKMEYTRLPASMCKDSRYSIALKNGCLNRYPDILPYDSTRVILPPIPEGCEYSSSEGFIPLQKNPDTYINASNVKVDDINSIILTQGPKPETVDTFWWMIFSKRSCVIGMFTKPFEQEKCKSTTYWPKTQGQVLYVLGGKLKITNILTEYFDDKSKDVDKMVIVDLLLEFTLGNEIISHKVKHFHYKKWPDHGVPETVSSELLFFLDYLRTYKEETNTTPFVLHCSAGCGRAGVICAAFRMLITRETLFETVVAIRQDRPNLVQSAGQYYYIFRLVNKK